MSEIRSVSNGYIVNYNGEEYIASTLAQAAVIIGEYFPTPEISSTVYAEGQSAMILRNVRSFARQGEKINAIKELRNCFTPRLGLCEAKEMVDTFFYD